MATAKKSAKKPAKKPAAKKSAAKKPAAKLQDSINRRLINADEKLKQVFGGKRQVSMFEMTKLVSNHLK